jgi:outer membrane biogenesis lipoprotein LolB
VNAKSDKFLPALLALLLLLSACAKKVTRPASAAPAAKAEVNTVITRLKAGEADYRHFSAKARLLLTPDGDKDFGATLHLRMERGQYLWASVSVALGIEAARLYVTSDSVFVLNRLKKEYVAQSLSYFQQFTSAPVSLNTLQQLFTGNTLFVLPDTLRSDSASAAGWFFSMPLQQVVYAVYVNKDNLRPTAQHLTDSVRQQHLQVLYSDYQKEDVQNIPRKIALQATAKARMKVTFDYQNVSFAPFDPIQFSIPASYRPAQ